MAFRSAMRGFAVAVAICPSSSLRVEKEVNGEILDEQLKEDAGPISPHELLPPGVLETLPKAMTLKKYDQISKDVIQLINKLSSKCTSTTCDDGEFAGCLLRMAGHDFMDYDGKGKGGSDGCVDWKDPDNNGLKECMVGGRNGGGELSQAWVKHRQEVSLADFLVIAAEAAMVRQRGKLQPKLEFRKNFKFGRVTNPDCRGQVHLPDPKDGCAATKRVFGKQLGLSDRHSAALMGVHTLGRARLENSGFDGWWSDPHNSRVFNNNFYISMLLKGWAPEKTSKGQVQWGRVGARELEKNGTQNHPELMLNTDICLAYGDHAQFAHKQDCCAWIMPDAFPGDGAKKAMAVLKEQEKNEKDLYCGFKFPAKKIMDIEFKHVKRWCCEDGPKKGPKKDCGDPSKLEGMAAKDVMEFAVDEKKWLEEFHKAWSAVTEINPFNGLTKAK